MLAIAPRTVAVVNPVDAVGQPLREEAARKELSYALSDRPHLRALSGRSAAAAVEDQPASVRSFSQYCSINAFTAFIAATRRRTSPPTFPRRSAR